jgi:pimeloyl-ACP methyl ester carboxylesterase
MRYIYLHGFASRPASQKATYFRERFAERGLELHVPALDGGNFEGLTITGQLEVIREHAAGEPCVLIGSSLGGYLAAVYASRHPEVERIVLLAPAFCFPRRWEDELGAETFAAWKAEGSRPVFHYGEGREMRIGFGLIEDGMQYEDYPAATQPSLLLHGLSDTVVPVEYSRHFVELYPECSTLVEIETDHEMGDVLPLLWSHTSSFLFDGPEIDSQK